MSDSKIKPLLLRMTVIVLGALVIGVIVNEHYTRGIRLEVLKLSLPWIRDKGWTTVSADSAFFMVLDGETIFIDVRDKDDFQLDHIEGALSIPFIEDFTNSLTLDSLEPNKKIILYDLERNTPAPRLVARYLAGRNFQSVNVMRGGYIEWLDKRFPIETVE